MNSDPIVISKWKIPLYLKYILFFFTISSSTCFAASPSSDPHHSNKELYIAVSSLPKSLHPLLSFSSSSQYTFGFMNRPMTTYDHNSKLICLLCETLPEPSFPPQKNDKKITLNVTLKDDIFWSDGTPLTSDDFIFTFKLAQHPKTKFPGSTLFVDDIEEIKKIDDTHFQITRHGNLYNPSDFSDFWPLPEHIEGEVLAKLEANTNLDYEQVSIYHQDPLHKGLYNGPFIPEKFETTGYLKLIQNPHFQSQKPKLDEIHISELEDATLMQWKFLNGEFDLIPAHAQFPILQALDINLDKHENIEINYQSSIGQDEIIFNLSNPVLQNEKVRKALFLAIHKKDISQKVFKGKIYVSETALKYAYDLKKAQRLLYEAGCSYEKNTLYYKGQPVRFEMKIISGNRSRQLVAELIAAYWKALGIDLRIIQEPARQFFGQTLKQRDFKDMVFLTWPKSPHFVPRPNFSSDMIPSAQNKYQGYNYSGYNRPEIDQALLELGQTYLGPSLFPEQTEIWERIDEIISNDLPVLPLFKTTKVQLLQNNLKGMIKSTPHYYPESFYAETWSKIE